jgi:hypothetical protein
LRLLRLLVLLLLLLLELELLLVLELELLRLLELELLLLRFWPLRVWKRSLTPSLTCVQLGQKRSGVLTVCSHVRRRRRQSRRHLLFVTPPL